MTRTATDYRDEQLALQPPGVALPTDPDSSWAQLLAALGGELARVDERGQDVLDEALPDATLELLPDWERVAGLPDECRGNAQSLQERRNALVDRLSARGGQHVQYYVDVASRLNYNVDVEEHRAFRVGTAYSQVGIQPLNPPAMRLVWRVRVLEARTKLFRVGQSQVGTDELLDIDRADDLECLLPRLKPAHTRLFVAYEGV